MTTKTSVLALLCISCGAETSHVPEPITFEEYRDRYALQGRNGTWWVEEDLPFETERDLFNYYSRNVLGREPNDSALTVKNSGDVDAIWPVDTKLALSYCIGDTGSEANYTKIRDAMDQATREWEFAADINFIHMSDFDGDDCEPGENGVLFRVRRGEGDDCTGERPLACAFFPDWSSRELKFMDAGLAKGWSEFLGITRHELGHVLGLWHEHARFDQSGAESACKNSIGGQFDWRGVTHGDENSVMGYHFCKGIAGGSLARDISRYDAMGLRYLYNLPRGYGRLHSSLSEKNNFLENNQRDDILWYTSGDNVVLFQSIIAGNAINFAVHDHCTLLGHKPSVGGNEFGFNFDGVPYRRTGDCHPEGLDRKYLPFSVRWYRENDSNLNREVFLYGRGASVYDAFLINRDDGFFTQYRTMITGRYLPITGSFNAPGVPTHWDRTEILWYEPGTSSDYLYQIDDELDARGYEVVEDDWLKPNDDFYDVLVGRFDLAAISTDEILWYDGCYGEVWKGDGAHGFDTNIIDMNQLLNCSASLYLPLLGDFDGDTYGDIFWYGPGDLDDELWLMQGTLWELSQTYVVDQVPQVVDGLYKPIVGDFNGDGRSDIFWYRPGSGSDSVWLFNADGSHISLPFQVLGDFSPIAGDFNADTCDDILWFDPIGARLIPWRSTCTAGALFQELQTIDTPARAYPIGFGIGR